MTTLEQRIAAHLVEVDDIHKVLTDRINEIDPRLIEGDPRPNKTTGKIKFYEWDLYEAGLAFTDYPQWDGDSGASFRISRDVFFDEEAHDRAVARLDADEAKSKEDEAAAILEREAKNKEIRRATFLKLREEFGEEEG